MNAHTIYVCNFQRAICAGRRCELERQQQQPRRRQQRQRCRSVGLLFTCIGVVRVIALVSLSKCCRQRNICTSTSDRWKYFKGERASECGDIDIRCGRGASRAEPPSVERSRNRSQKEQAGGKYEATQSQRTGFDPKRL